MLFNVAVCEKNMERYADAIKWYDEAFKLNPKDVNVSTDLGVSYYYTNQPDKALAQFDDSVAGRPVRHTVGIGLNEFLPIKSFVAARQPSVLTQLTAK